MMSPEQKTIRMLFNKLIHSPLKKFPEPLGKIDAPNKQGVYVIYDPHGRVVHVGQAPSSSGGIRQRLGDHLNNASSFASEYLKGDGARLSGTHSYRCLPVADQRRRALLEAYGIGSFCPAYIGLGPPRVSRSK